MAPLRNSIFLAFMAASFLAREAAADGFDNHIYNYLGRGDTITIGAGNASRSNLAIQHPTPWPHYVNDTDIKTSARIGISAMEKMFKRYQPEGAASPSPASPLQGSSN